MALWTISFPDSEEPNSIKVANADKLKYPEQYSSSDLINRNNLELVEGKAPIWWNYFLCGVKGVVGELLEEKSKDEKSGGCDKSSNFGFMALMDGKVPPSAGLSSSSAVVVAASMCKYCYLLCNIDGNCIITILIANLFYKGWFEISHLNNSRRSKTIQM